MAGPRIPAATYRVQFNRNFRFDDARKIVSYLDALGITDLYASPLLASRRGSPHGYDVTDPARINPELGGREDFDALTFDLRQYQMGLLLDIVPNHMAASSDNPWWWDVLCNGWSSAYATFFDIDWHPDRPGLNGKVLLPILGEPYGQVLEKQEIKLMPAKSGFQVRYGERRLPLSPVSSLEILSRLTGGPAGFPDTGPAASFQLTEIINQKKFSRETQEDSCQADFRQAWNAFWDLYSSSAGVKKAVKVKLRHFNGQKGDPQSFSYLDHLLTGQAYRLAFWRTANKEINYRRFFDVSDLVSVRVEEEKVFEAIHRLVFKLAGAGQVTGLRIDHIDGLYDPEAYLRRLGQHLSGNGRQNSFYVVVEKILADGEDLPPVWPVYGTTGYDFLNMLNGLFIDKQGIEILNRIYTGLGCLEDFAAVVYNQKKKVATELFAGEVRTLARQLSYLAEEDRYGRDLTLADLEQALIEITACLPVYRSYTRGWVVADRDRAYIEQAVAMAMKHSSTVGPACKFLRRVLLLEFPPDLPLKLQQDWVRLIMRWQQFTGPFMAKGVEDTAFYLYNRLISLNEVGGNPGGTGISVPEFHLYNEKRLKESPHTLNATSTHDTKRSEDVRARINILAEIPDVWAEKVERWQRLNEPGKSVLNGCPVPGSNMEMLIYQTLIGAWPLQEGESPSFKDRIQAYVVKAAREAKEKTSWLFPDAAYEEALKKFINFLLEPGNDFWQDMLDLQKIIAPYGAINSLAQVLLKITSPGVPDFYQGMEFWNFSLVDPDNRRPVDYAARSKLLAELQKEEAGGQLELVKKLLAFWDDGRVKLYLTYKALNLRKFRQELFAAGAYLPVKVNGPYFEHACSFIRCHGGQWVLVAVPRMPARLQASISDLRAADPHNPASLLAGSEIWGGNVLLLPVHAPDSWQNILTGEYIQADFSNMGKVLPLAKIFSNFPVTLLTEV